VLPAQDASKRQKRLHSELRYKRLEVGVFKLPRPEGARRAVELRASELAMILDGIDVSRLKRVQRYERPVG
jgi:transposase